MPAFEAFDVVAVPFPYVEREARKRRPALIISARTLTEMHGLAWVLMITSAANEPWPDDIPIHDLDAAGLPKPSVVRPAKIATVEAGRCERIGRLTEPEAARVTSALGHLMAAALRPL